MGWTSFEKFRMEETNVTGSEIDKITMLEKVSGIFVDMLRGYPAWIYHGIIEGRFKGNLGNVVRDKLEEDKFIQTSKINGTIHYRLTSKGAEFAYFLSTKKKVRNYGFIGAVLMGMTIIIGLAHLFLTYFQSPIPLL